MEARMTERAIIIIVPNKREWNNCFIKNAQNIDKSSQPHLVRTNRKL